MSPVDPKRPEIILRKGAMLQTVHYVQGYNWRCSVCGWVGIDCFGAKFAISEAETHFKNEHPDLTPFMDFDDER